MSDRTIRRQANAGRRCTVAERRAWVRYPAALEGVCYTPASAWGAFWKASIHDLSQGGIGLVLNEPFPADTVVAIELKSQRCESVRVFTARVRHVTSIDLGRWLVGCEFLRPLSKDDLAALL
jgi:hypothetical protein